MATFNMRGGMYKGWSSEMSMGGGGSRYGMSGYDRFGYDKFGADVAARDVAGREVSAARAVSGAGSAEKAGALKQLGGATASIGLIASTGMQIASTVEETGSTIDKLNAQIQQMQAQRTLNVIKFREQTRHAELEERDTNLARQRTLGTMRASYGVNHIIGGQGRATSINYQSMLYQEKIKSMQQDIAASGHELAITNQQIKEGIAEARRQIEKAKVAEGLGIFGEIMSALATAAMFFL